MITKSRFQLSHYLLDLRVCTGAIDYHRRCGSWQVWMIRYALFYHFSLLLEYCRQSTDNRNGLASACWALKQGIHVLLSGLNCLVHERDLRRVWPHKGKVNVETA